MADFVPINTQEEFDNAIKERIERERAKYADYESIKESAQTLKTSLDEANNKVSSMEMQISELSGKIKGYEADSEKTRIALENGIPFEFRDRIKGETAEEMEKDAKKIAEFFKKSEKKAPPLKKESESGDSSTSAYKNMLNEMFSEKK